MSKNIWIINEYAGTPYYGMTFRHYYLAKELVRLGHKVTIFTSSFSHYKLKQHLEVHLLKKMPNYKAPKSLGRIRNWFYSFFKIRETRFYFSFFFASSSYSFRKIFIK